jgi:hypothetical protein
MKDALCLTTFAIGVLRNWWTPKNLVFAVTILSLACVAAVVAYPEPVQSAALGPDWQCTRLAFVWTTCTRVTRAGAAVARKPACPGRAGVATGA